MRGQKKENLIYVFDLHEIPKKPPCILVIRYAYALPVAGLYTPDGREAILKHVETTDSLSLSTWRIFVHTAVDVLHIWLDAFLVLQLSLSLSQTFRLEMFWPFCARNKTIRPELKWHFGCKGILQVASILAAYSESKVGDGCNIHRQILVVCVRICWAMIPYLWISVSYVDLRISHPIEISDYKKLSDLHIIMSHLANGQLLNLLGSTLVPYQYIIFSRKFKRLLHGPKLLSGL